MNKNLISISGRKDSGKDTVGKIIQKLTGKTSKRFSSLLNKEVEINTSSYQIKKWADSVKQICSIILGVPVSKFEDRKFKESELSEEWWYIHNVDVFGTKYPYSRKDEFSDDFVKNNTFKPTVRWLLQNIGTEVGRNIHPDIWVNVLMNQYKPSYEFNNISDESIPIYPQWIITDTRFENELKVIKGRDGICIKVVRFDDNPNISVQQGNKPSNVIEDLHISETSLDHIENWDYVIENNGSIEDLIEKVQEFLKQFKIV